MSLLFVGDWLPRVDAAPLEMVKTSIAVANLECAIADASHVHAKAYPIIASFAVLNTIAQSGFSALNLANNHVYDAGSDAFNRMVLRLQELETVQLYGLSDRPYAEMTVNGKRCAIVGCLESCRARGSRLFREEHVERLIRSIRKRFDRVFVTPHWGKEGEYASHPSPAQRRLAQRWIEAGADGIAGHHSHTLQSHEMINGRPVYYSLGNYHFGHDEGNQYFLTAYGLAVECSLSEQTQHDSWCRHFLHQSSRCVHSLQDERSHLLETFLQSISADLIDKERPWNSFRWACANGGIYIAKSRHSWARRLRHATCRTLPLWAIWHLHPLTLWLKLGHYMANRKLQNRLGAISQALSNARWDRCNENTEV